MTTTSSQLEVAILAAVNREVKLNVRQIYDLVPRAINLTADDHQLIVVSNKATEPAWQRNVRNVLQRLKQTGKLVNQPKGFWQLPISKPAVNLSPSEAWSLTIMAGSSCFLNGEVWYSPIELREYKISKITDNAIEVERLSGGNNTRLTRADLTRAINVMNAAGGKVLRRSLNRVVAKEAAIVFLHPQLSYDILAENIVIDDSLSITDTIVSGIIGREAPDDDTQNFVNQLRRVRKGQRLLKTNLLHVYDFRCCVSGTGPVNVLEAAHVEQHSVGGSNISTNALLLRSDIHILYDDHLLAIHPHTLMIFLSPELKETSYWVLNATKLRPRADGKTPDVEKLQQRWNTISWIPLYS